MTDSYNDFIAEEDFKDFVNQLEESGGVLVYCARCGETTEVFIDTMEAFCNFCEADIVSPFDKYSYLLREKDN